METHHSFFSWLRNAKVLSGFLFGILAVALLLGAFGLGVKVGYRKAHFSFQWADNYHRNFGGPKQGWFRQFDDREFMDASGMMGQVLRAEGNILIVKGRDEAEKIILITDKTMLKRGRETLKITDLRVNDFVVVIGEPNDQGQIEAKLVRLMPAPPSAPKPPVPAPIPLSQNN